VKAFKWTEMLDSEREQAYQRLSNKLKSMRRYQIACQRILNSRDLKTAKSIARSILDLNLC
jgi:hypothetical protein